MLGVSRVIVEHAGVLRMQVNALKNPGELGEEGVVLVGLLTLL